MDASLELLSRLLRTLSDTNRLRIVQVLTLDCQSVTGIVRKTEMPQPLVSHHLRVMRDRGLVRSERRGAFTFY